MSEIKWIKVTTDIFDNKKIKQIESLPEGDAIIVIWIKLLCLAGEINESGYIILTSEIPFTDQMLATQFNRPLNTVQLAISTFVKFGMVEVIDDILCISNWEKYQNIDGMKKVREQTRKRVAKHRENKKKLECNVTCNDDVTPCNTDVTQQNKNKNKNKKDFNNTYIPNSINNFNNKNNIINRTFKPPLVDDVKQYCLERGNSVDAEAFVNFYESKGWMVGKNKMKDWKAAVRTWERNRFSEAKQSKDAIQDWERELMEESGNAKE